MDQPFTRIEIFSRWTGFADPPSLTEKLTIRACDEKVLREVAVEERCDEIDVACVQEFAVALGRPVLPELTPTAFDQPIGVIRQHFESFCTDDSPSVLVRVTDMAGDVILLRSESQHAFMLPLQFIDPVTDSVQSTYDPRLSRTLAALMPKGFLNRERLADYGGMFQFDLERAHRSEALDAGTDDEKDLSCSSEDVTPDDQLDELEKRIHRLFSREESPEEFEEAEQSGNHSQRLFKRIPLKELAMLLERGADPNVADDAGQTTLMHAAFPPFNRERFDLLWKAGAKLETRRNDGLNGLHLACSGGEAETAAVWVAVGADVNAVATGGATPLMFGASWDNIVTMLLAHNAAVNTRDEDGYSALAYAVLKQKPIGAKSLLNSIRALLAAGADVGLLDKQGLSPIDHARRVLARVDLEKECLQAFMEARTTEERHQWEAARKQHVNCLEQYRLEHPEDEWLTNTDYDNRKLAIEIVELLTTAVRGD